MRITATEQEILEPEILSFRKALRDEGARAPYEVLLTEVREGDVKDDLLGHLGNVLEVGLQSGRLRRFYGADGEQALASLFRRTPRGSALSQAAATVTEALSALEGQVISDMSISALGPGTYGLSIDTDRCQISLRLDRGGVAVENVAVGI